MAINKVILIGNVGKDPDIRYIDQQVKVATLTLATTEKYKDRAGMLKENTEWHNLVAWRNTADIIERYVRKGSQIYVEGKLRTRQYLDSNKQQRHITEIIVDTLQLLGKREGTQGTQAAAPMTTAPEVAQIYPPRAQGAAAAVQQTLDIDEPTDDLPF